MKVFSPFLNGTTTTSGSFNVPNHPGTGSIPNPLTGSLFHDDTDGILKVYTGTQWAVVGEQSIPPITVDYLVVAGGGAGGVRHSGGGGAGGLRTSFGNTSGGGASAEDSITLVKGTSYSIIIGGGGTFGTEQAAYAVSPQPTDGNDSTFYTITSIGGGQGSYGEVDNSGYPGGSGGGSGDASGTAWPGGSGTSGQGYDGGNGSISYAGGGGGGGAAAAGGNGGSNNGGNGGNGLQTSINGTPTYFAGGGGGAPRYGGSSGTRGQGGLGGGGDSDNSGDAGTSVENGVANTGGGGGAHSTNYPTAGSGNSGSGGSGVVILRILTSQYSGTTTGSPTVTTDGDYTILIYSGSGTYTA